MCKKTDIPLAKISTDKRDRLFFAAIWIKNQNNDKLSKCCRVHISSRWQNKCWFWHQQNQKPRRKLFCSSAITVTMTQSSFLILLSAPACIQLSIKPLELTPAVTGLEVGCTLDRSPICGRAVEHTVNTDIFAQIQKQSRSDLDNTLYKGWLKDCSN